MRKTMTAVKAAAFGKDSIRSSMRHQLNTLSIEDTDPKHGFSSTDEENSYPAIIGEVSL